MNSGKRSKNFSVVIEVLKGSGEKYELDETDGKIKLDFVFKNLDFPFYYGYLPGTRGGDGDMLDAAVISSLNFRRGQAVACRAIGYAEVVDRGQADDKILAVPAGDREFMKYKDIGDVPDEILEQWKLFWAEVARQKRKIMEVKAFHCRKRAEELVRRAGSLQN